MITSERFGLDLPDDFPVAGVEALHAHLSDRQEGANQTTEWREWATGVNGVLYRYISCDRHVDEAIASLRNSVSPAQPQRHRQEEGLFAFFYEGLSCLECLYYGLYFIGTLADPAHFSLSVNRRSVTPSFVTKRYIARFPTEPLAQRLAAVESSSEYGEWSDIRNFLSHRGVSGRTFYEGGERHGSVDWNLPIQSVDVSTLLDPDDLQQRRDWLGGSVIEVIDAADAFARQNVP